MLIYAFDSGPESGELLLGRRALIVVSVNSLSPIVIQSLNQFLRTRWTTLAKLSSKCHLNPCARLPIDVSYEQLRHHQAAERC